jgi:hypothetical protein
MRFDGVRKKIDAIARCGEGSPSLSDDCWPPQDVLDGAARDRPSFSDLQSRTGLDADQNNVWPRQRLLPQPTI